MSSLGDEIEPELKNVGPTPSAVPPEAPLSYNTYQDIDSDELEQLEDEAENESESEIDRLVDEAEEAFPAEAVQEMLKDLRQGGMVHFLERYILQRQVSIKKLLVAFGVLLPKSMRGEDVPEASLIPALKSALSRILRCREKLPEYNTVDDAVELIKKSKRIIVLSGAGISVSCGIPDFRSKDGIYANLQREGKYELDDPQDMFDMEYFLNAPQVFYSFAHSIFPSNFEPSPSHRFIKLLEDRRALLRNYSQNIDTLEQAAGITRLLQCHGSFATAMCTDPLCRYKAPGSSIKKAIFAREVPLCPRCHPSGKADSASSSKASKSSKKKGKSGWGPGGDSEDDENGGPSLAYGIMKPSICFFGEKLSDEFDHCVLEDREAVDLLLVIGTSLQVAPVSELVVHFPHSTPVILINKTPVTHIKSDIMLLGESDVIVSYICQRLGWQLPWPKPIAAVVGEDDDATAKVRVEPEEHKTDAKLPAGIELLEPQRLGESHLWLFPGAEVDQSIIDQLRPESESPFSAQSDSGDRGSPEIRHDDQLATRNSNDTDVLGDARKPSAQLSSSSRDQLSRLSGDQSSTEGKPRATKRPKLEGASDRSEGYH